MDWKDYSLTAFADALGKPGYAPAGGSAAAVTAALAAALCAMTAGLGVKAGHVAMQPLEAEVLAVQNELLDLAQQDTDAYGAYVLTKREKDITTAAVDAALIRATEVPLLVVQHAARVITILRQAMPHCPPAARPDGLTGIGLAEAASKASLLNARANAARLVGDGERKRMLGQIAELEQLIEEKGNS